MRAGKLRTPMMLLQRTQSGTDADGQPTFTYPTTGPRVWVGRAAFRGRELFEARAELGADVERLRVRYRSGLTRLDRLKDPDGNVYHIEGVENVDARNHEMLVLATKLGAGN